MPNFTFATEMPFSVQDLRDEFDRLVDRVWHGGLTTAPLDGQDWAPRMDVYERSDSFLVRLEVPGVSADDVDVSILKSVLTVKGKKREPQDVSDATRKLRTECRFGSFCRKYDLASPVNEENVSATCKDGVLFIRIQKQPEAFGRTVKVTSD
ncbi:MAG: Hsp20/alpha crystallin family protein [Planctomycetes bacterium]|nr:Hsp20/alpha crystallin family protein [Planctomycetota bacterium]